ncbi:MAG: DUF3631 domain-containing protein [Chloroflexi bacterium]|nr:DUF3631 domain-containing protein [Chloroflexota bacterium]
MCDTVLLARGTPTELGEGALEGIQDAFEDVDHLATAELLRRLHDMDDAPWGDWYGSPITARGLAKLLGPFRVVPVQKRVRGEKSRGYFRADFADAWGRYVADLDVATSGTRGTRGTDQAASLDEPGTHASDEPAYHGTPLTRPRLCPSCQLMHPAGVTCGWVGDHA